MPLQVFMQSHYCEVHGHGSLTREDLENYVLQRTYDESGDLPTILDLTQVESIELGYEDVLSMLASCDNRAHAPGCPIALAVSSEVAVGVARMFERARTEKLTGLRIFGSVDEARAWALQNIDDEALDPSPVRRG